jgi:hypothetical protein
VILAVDELVERAAVRHPPRAAQVLGGIDGESFARVAGGEVDQRSAMSGGERGQPILLRLSRGRVDADVVRVQSVEGRGEQQRLAAELADHAQELPVSSGAIVGDTLTMELWMEYESYTDAMIPMSLTTELYGLSCPPYILANYLTGLEITSSNDFNDIPAGQLLNDIIKDENTGVTISELIAEMQLINAYRFADLTLSFLEKPELPEHQFHFLFTDNAGNTFSGHSETIVWQ